MEAALIDNGISCTDILKNRITGRKEFQDKKALKISGEYFKPVHGTTCAEIINSICQDLNFLDLRILEEDGTTQISVFLKALDWCIQNRIKLIHMSLGTINYFDIKPLETRFKKLLGQDSIIIAAYHNKNIRTYPAAFPGVFGVRQDIHEILQNNQFMIQELQGVNRENSLVAHWCQEEGRNLANSYAAPVITGHIGNYLNENPSAGFPDVLKYLEEKAVQGKMYPDMLKNVVRKKENIETPIIAGFGLLNGVMKKLTKIFNNEEYQALLLQEHLTDGRAIPFQHYKYYDVEDISLTNILYTVNWVYKPDIILLDFAGEKNFSKLELSDIDICIFYEDQIYKIYAEKLIGTANKIVRICEIIFQYYE